MVSEIFLSQYEAARRHSASIPLDALGWIVVSGRDRASYLQGLLTNDTQALNAGEGCYAAYLTPQGRMITDLSVYELGDVMLLSLPLHTTSAVLSKLDQFIFSEDVQLGDVSGTFAGVSVVGPEAARAVAAVLPAAGDLVAGLPMHGNLRAPFEGGSSIVLRVADRGEAGFDILVEARNLPSLQAALLAAGVIPLDPDVADVLRLEAGIPRFGLDMSEETIPLEAGIESRAISFNKGCYVGQEVIIRVLHRGHGRVARRLVGLLIDGVAVPERGTAIEADGKAVGSITSAGWSPARRQLIALGYVHRDFVTPGTAVSAAGTPAVVAALPFHQ